MDYNKVAYFESLLHAKDSFDILLGQTTIVVAVVVAVFNYFYEHKKTIYRSSPEIE